MSLWLLGWFMYTSSSEVRKKWNQGYRCTCVGRYDLEDMGARSAGICRAQMNKYPSRWLKTAEVADPSLIPLMHPQIVGFTKPFRGLCALVRRCMRATRLRSPLVPRCAKPHLVRSRYTCQGLKYPSYGFEVSHVPFSVPLPPWDSRSLTGYQSSRLFTLCCLAAL